MKMFVAGEWVDKDKKISVVNPYDGNEIDTIPRSEESDIDAAITSAARGAKVMAKMPAHERYRILKKAADLLEERREEHARIITLEEGKVIAEGRVEVDRAVQTLTGSAEEAKRIHGETVPLDGAPSWSGQFGFTMRVPCGIVAAISPFQLPLEPGDAQGRACVGGGELGAHQAGHGHAAVGAEAG